MNRIDKKKIISIILFFIYLCLLVYLLFFAENMGRKVSTSAHNYNMELFKEIKRFYIYRDKFGIFYYLNVYGNILAFMPFGFFLPMLSTKVRKFIFTVFLGFAFSVMVEITQFIVAVGSFDVDDILLNTVGVILGYIVFKILNCFYVLQKRWK